MVFQTKKDRSAFTRSVFFEHTSFELLFFFSLSLQAREKCNKFTFCLLFFLFFKLYFYLLLFFLVS